MNNAARSDEPTAVRPTMRLLVEFSHPAQVHKFKHVLRQLMEDGHAVLVLSRDKDVMLHLLEAEGLPHRCISRARSGLLGMAMELLIREVRTLVQFLRFRPDLVFSAHSVAIVHVGWLFRVPRIVHDDTEHATLQQSLYMPFATHIVTTTAYLKDFGPRQIRLNSLEPLAYLHPARFVPEPSRLERYGLKSTSDFVVVRIIAWSAAHDIGLKGQSSEVQSSLIKALLDAGADKVVLASEKSTDLNDNRIVTVRPTDFHHVLAHARLCVTEGGSVANEAAALGVPTVLLNPLKAGLFDELERYGLLMRPSSMEEAIQVGQSILKDPESGPRWRAARNRLLEEKVDMTEELVALMLRIGDAEISR